MSYHIRQLTAAEAAACSVDLDGNPCKPEDFEAGWYYWEGDSDLTTGHWDYMQGPFTNRAEAVEFVNDYTKYWE